MLTSGIGITARAIDQTAEAAELTLVQWRVLVIASQTEGLRIGELAAHLGISIPSASRLVRRIEAQGLVTAMRADDDRRATNIALTKAGREIVDAVVRRRRELIGLALSADPERSAGRRGSHRRTDRRPAGGVRMTSRRARRGGRP